jgi:hypothetical protein
MSVSENPARPPDQIRPFHEALDLAEYLTHEELARPHDGELGVA